MNIGDALQNAAETLKASDVPDPAREARSLLSFVLQRDTAFLIAHPEVELTADRKLLFQSCVRRRAGHEPFQYITGRQEFFGLDFLITPDVLVPRPETEILVEAAIDILADVEAANVCEIGVGSGCISIAIVKNVVDAHGAGVDISEAALAVARRNAEMHGVAGRLVLEKGNVFDGVSGSFDLIVSNPPYVPAADIGALQAEVREFEPHLALDGGDDGLDIVRQMIRDSPDHLKPGGTLLMEIGFDQSPKVRDLFDQTLWHEPDFLPDLQGIPRIVKAVLRPTV
jgi:release factor glutamine methyltransferase